MSGSISLEEHPAPQIPNNRRRLFTESESSDAYPSIADQEPKRVRILHQIDERIQRPIGVDLSDPESEEGLLSYDEGAEMDPDFLLNTKQAKQFKEAWKRNHENEKIYQMFLIAEQKSRAVKVAELAGKEVGQQDKRNAKLLAVKENGNANQDFLVDEDADNLLYLPCKPPSTTNADNNFGPPGAADSFCFACSRGVGFPFINGTLVEELEKYIREVIPNCEPLRAAVKISRFYDKEIRAVVNVKLNVGEVPLPEWSPRAVLDCLQRHRSDSSLWLHFTLKKLEEDEEIIRENGTYVVNQEVIESGRQPTQRDLRVREKYHRMWLENIKMQASLRKMNPLKMFGHNEKLSVASTIGRAIGPKENTFGQLKITSLFNKP